MKAKLHEGKDLENLDKSLSFLMSFKETKYLTQMMKIPNWRKKISSFYSQKVPV
jgi:hypothetical protein